MKIKENHFVPRKPDGAVRSQRIVNPNLHPKGGYKFKDADGVEHSAQTLDSLVRSLAKYRARVGRPPGNPERECIEFICSRSPQSCLDIAVKYDRASLANAVTQDMALATQRETKMVDEVTAREREKTCLKCPNLLNWDKNCPTCIAKVGKLRDMIIPPGEIFSGLLGKACLSARDDATLAVWRVENQKVINPPGECWRSDD